MYAPPIPSRNALDMITSHRPRSSGILHFLQFIRTLSFVVGITLGAGSVFAAVWSKFLLPLLYSTFSARKAVTEQQLLAFHSIVSSLKSIRASGIYGPIPATSGHQGIGGTQVVNEKELGDAVSATSIAKITDSLLIEEIPDDTHHITSRLPTLSLLITPSSSSFLETTQSRLTTLPETLTTLELSMDATSTTRTSLLSTLSSFTSHLHTQSFQFATRRTGGYGGGMSSLDANLVKAGATLSSSETGALAEGQGGEKGYVSVDDVKKEIRGLKGLLLSRREFPHMKR